MGLDVIFAGIFINMRNKGFTLIEIIIAITIIAMISGGGLVSVFNALRNSRDAKRKGDLEQIRTALEIYKADKGYYPTPAAGWHNLAIPGDGVYIALVSGGYINAMPTVRQGLSGLIRLN